MMKSVAVAALCFFAAVAAEADADAEAHYGYYGNRSADAEPAADAHLGLGYYGYPLVAAAAPVVSTVHGGPLHGLSYGGYHLIGKRSADAEPTADAAPEADADAFYHHGYAHYGHGLHHGYALAHHGHHGYLGYYGHPYLHHGYY